MQFLFIAALTLAGFWLAGFSVVHWLLYIPPAALLFAVITGICPCCMIFRKPRLQGQD